jgi:hypothetical protein
MGANWDRVWFFFMLAWSGLFLGLLLTEALLLMVFVGSLASLFCLALATDWRGAARVGISEDSMRAETDVDRAFDRGL